MIIQRIDFSSPQYDELLQLRDLVLRQPLNMVFYEEDIANEYENVAFALLKNDIIVGCMQLALKDSSAKMRQVAVHPDHQGKGIGQMLVDYCEKWSLNNGYLKVELHARITAVRFYQKLGYNIVGEIFQEVGIDHFYMVKHLLNTTLLSSSKLN